MFDPDGAPLEISAAEGWEITSLDYTPPKTEMMAVGSVATEGELSAGSKVGNRTNTATIEYVGEGADDEARHADMRAKLTLLEQKVGKLTREGGVWRRVLHDGSTIDFYIRQFNATGLPTDIKFVFGQVGEITLEALCAPFGVGSEFLVGSFGFGGSDPVSVLECEVADVPGSAPALARARISSPDVDVWELLHGRESRYYSDAATAKCFYEAEDLTLGPSSSIATLASASGGASNNAVQFTGGRAEWVEILSDEMTHIGTFGFYVWLHAEMSSWPWEFMLEYSLGDISRRTRLAPVQPEVSDRLVRVDMGEVRLTPARASDHVWKWRLLARRPAAIKAETGSVWVDAVGLLPLAEGNGSLSAVATYEPPLEILLQDDFYANAGNLHGKALADGAGSWVTGGDATDFDINTSLHRASRSAVDDDAGVGRYALAGATEYALMGVQVDMRASAYGTAGEVRQGLQLRHSAAGAVQAIVYNDSGAMYAAVNVDGTVIKTSRPFSLTPNTMVSIRAIVDVAGRFWVWVFPVGGFASGPIVLGQAPELAAGGDLEVGQAGFYDEHRGVVTSTREYGNFFVFVPNVDAACYAGAEAELAHDGALRQSSDGEVWAPMSEVRRDYLKLAPAGVESRVNRLVLMPSAHPPAAGASDPVDLAVAVYVTPRYWSVPDPVE